MSIIVIYNIHFFKILYFKLHSINSILIEILAYVDNQNERLNIENDFALKHSTSYTYGLNTV